MPALNFFLPLLVLLFVSGPVYSQNKSGDPPAGSVPAAQALPKLEAIEKEFLKIANETGKVIEKIVQEQGYSGGYSVNAGYCPRNCWAYIKAHGVEEGIPAEWIPAEETPPSNYGPEWPDDNATARVGGIEIESFVSNVADVPLQNLYRYHLFLLKETIYETRSKGFIEEREFNKIVTGFEYWKKLDAQTRVLVRESLTRGAIYMKLNGPPRSTKVMNCVDSYAFSSPLIDPNDWRGVFPITPPNQEVIASWLFPECRAIYTQLWQLEYDLGQLYVKLVYTVNQLAFGSVKPKEIWLKAPGSGANEII